MNPQNRRRFSRDATPGQPGDRSLSRRARSDRRRPAIATPLRQAVATITGIHPVYYYLRRWQREGVWDRVHQTLVMADRERSGREASPTAAILDSQSIKTADQKG